MTEIISVVSIRGGHGTTTIAANLAAVFALNGRKVCVVDCSMEYTDLGEMLGVEDSPAYTISDYLSGRCQITDTVLPSTLQFSTSPAGTVDVLLFGKSRLSMIEVRKNGIDLGFLADGLHELRQNEYDYIIIDSGHGLSEENMLLMGISDGVLVIMSEWKTRSWTDAAVFGDIAKKLDVGRRVLVANKFPAHRYLYDRDLFNRIEKAMIPTFSLAVILPQIKEIADGIGIFAVEHPTHPVAGIFKECVQYFGDAAGSADRKVLGLQEQDIQGMFHGNTVSQTRKLRVFLCHASQDKSSVRRIHRSLTKVGWIDPWLDEEKLLPGEDWNLEIDKTLETTDVVLVCFSNHSITKEGYVQKEIRKVLDVSLEKPEGTIFVIPVRLEQCEIPRSLSKWQCVDYFVDGSLERIIKSLEKRFKSSGRQTT